MDHTPPPPPSPERGPLAEPGATPRHPLLECADTIRSALDRVRDVDPVYLPTTDKAAVLLELHRAEARLHAIKLRVLAVSGDVAEVEAARSPGAWLDKHTACGHRAGRREEDLAAGLAGRWTATGTALAEGLLTGQHATAIVASLERLPADLDPDVAAVCEKELVELAARFSPEELRRVGQTILSRVAPQVGEEHDRQTLEAEERRARTQTWLQLGRGGDGTTHVRGRIPDSSAARLRTLLESFAAPRQQDRHGAPALPSGTSEGAVKGAAGPAGPAGEVTRLPYDQRLGLAFCALLERIPEMALPEHGGSATTVNVLIDHDSLVAGVGTAVVDDGTAGGMLITAGECRRLACTAHLVPVVLGTDSEVLDLGRRVRLFSPPQRKALMIRDRHCRAAGCTIPATWCEAHHLHPWSRGGHTDLVNGILLCSFHHHRMHDVRYEHRLTAERTVEFHRRT